MRPTTIAVIALAPLVLIGLCLLIVGRRMRKRAKQRAAESYNHQAVAADFLIWLQKVYDNRNIFTSEEDYLLCAMYGGPLKNVLELDDFSLFVDNAEHRAQLVAIFERHHTGIRRALTEPERQHLLGD